MDGISTRFAYKILSETFNFDSNRGRRRPGAPDVRAGTGDPARAIAGGDRGPKYLEFIKEELAPRYADFIGNEIQKAYLESYHDYGQNLFDRYVAYADAWIEDQDFKDPDTGQLMNRELLNRS
jgi:serine protein kinase